MGTAGVIGNNATVFDDEPGDGTGGVFTVDQHVGGHFSKDMIAQAAAFDAFQVKRVGQVFLNEGEDAVVAIDKVGDHQVPIVVAIRIHFAQEQVGAMSRADPADLFILAEEHHTGQGNPGLAGLQIVLDQLGALEQVGIVHVCPRVIFAVEPNLSATLVDQIRAEAAGLDKRINSILTVRSLLALIEAGDLHGVVGNIQVSIFVAVVNTAVATMNLGTFGHIDV